MAVIARITRSSMLEVLSADFIRTARAKGAEPVARRPAARPARRRSAGDEHRRPADRAVASPARCSPKPSSTGPAWADTWPVPSIGDKDYVAVQAAAIVIAAMFVSLNLVLDVVYVWLDPRIRLT